MNNGMVSECDSPAKRRRYGKTNLAQCSKSGSGKSVGQVSIFRGKQPVNNQQSSEAEDDLVLVLNWYLVLNMMKR